MLVHHFSPHTASLHQCRVSTTAPPPFLSGHLLYDFQAKMKEEETQLEEVDSYSP